MTKYHSYYTIEFGTLYEQGSILKKRYHEDDMFLYGARA